MHLSNLERGVRMKRLNLLVSLALACAMAWAVSLNIAFAADVPATSDVAPCRAVPSDRVPSKETLAHHLSQQQAEPIEPLPGDNCTHFASCGKLGCWRVFGGSQKVWNNRIPSCIKDPNPKCYDVQCRVATYGSADCTGDPIEDSWVTKRGCRRQ